VRGEAIAIEVQEFIVEHVHSVFQLEVLLLLHQNTEKDWSIEAVDKELNVGPEVVRAQLEDLHGRGLVTLRETEVALYRYNPSSLELDRAVNGLAKAYAERRVAIYGLIFSKPVDKVRLFAEAFRLKDDKRNG
jgi:hypothetical protein